jgi:3-oxoacyl-[acyl-carrier-protein] synthase-3
MRPEIRIVALRSYLPGPPVLTAELASRLGEASSAIESRTGVRSRHYADAGQGPSDLAVEAARSVLAQAALPVEDVDLIVFATATPDIAFPGAACFLQDKLGARTVGALDVRAQSVGFVSGLELAAAFAAQTEDGDDPYHRVLLAAGEVLSSGLDYSPRGADLTPRFGDGAAVALVGRADAGLRVGAIRWYVDGNLAESFWCEYPASRRHPLRIQREHIEAGLHHPRARLGELAPIARERLVAAAEEVLAEEGWRSEDLDAFVVDYVEPEIARRAAADLGIAPARTTVPTADFGHVLAAGVPIALARLAAEGRLQGRLLVAAAGPGFAWGAAALEA